MRPLNRIKVYKPTFTNSAANRQPTIGKRVTIIHGERVPEYIDGMVLGIINGKCVVELIGASVNPNISYTDVGEDISITEEPNPAQHHTYRVPLDYLVSVEPEDGWA